MREACETLYAELKQQGIDVILMDEHKARLGSMLADIELVGITHRVVVGDRGLDKGEIEYKYRRDAESSQLPANTIAQTLIAKIKG